MILNIPQTNYPHRRSIRLTCYDYSQDGFYFVTVCTYGRECLFGRVVNGQMELNGAGEMVKLVWKNLSVRFPFVRQDVIIVMPNHIHGIVIIHGRGESCICPIEMDESIQTGDHKDRPYGTLDATRCVIRFFHFFVFLRNFL